MVAAPQFGTSYEILRLLGEGGMGRVYLARETALSRLVAIKVLLADQGDDPSSLDRFQEEARVCASLKHRNIVRLFSSGIAEGAPYLVFEFVEGTDLKRELAAAGSLPWTAVNDLACGVLHGLQSAHELGIVHRDIKPANILLRAQTGEPMLMDFGVAKAQAGRRVTTMAGVLLGTVGYMAPELFGGVDASPASDLYSLGATLYEALTGRHPFEGGSDLDIIQRQLKSSPDSPSSVRAGVPNALSNVVLRALAREPSQRFGSAREMRAALEEATGRLVQSSVAIWPVAKAPSPRPPKASRATTAPRSRPSSGTKAIPARPGAYAGPATAVVPTAPRSRRSLHLFAGGLIALAAAALGPRGLALLRADPPSNVSVTASDDGTLEVRWSTRRIGRGGVRFEAQRAGTGVKTSTTWEAAPGTTHRVRLEELEPGTPCTLKFLTEAGDVNGTRTVAIPDCDQLRVISSADDPPGVRIVLPEGEFATTELTLNASGAPPVKSTTGPDGRLEFKLPGRRVADLAGAHVQVRMGPETVAHLHPTASRRMVERLTRKLDALDERALVAKAVKDPRFGDNLDLEFRGRVIDSRSPFFAHHQYEKSKSPLRSGTFREFLKLELSRFGLFDDLEAFRAVAASFFGDPGVPDERKRALYAGLIKLTYLDLIVATQHDLDSPRYRDLTGGLVRHTHALDPRVNPPGPAPPEVSLFDRPQGWVPRDFDGHLVFSMWAGSHRELQRVFKLGSDPNQIAAMLQSTPRKVTFPAAMRDRPGAHMTIRLRVAYLGAGYLYRVTIRGQAPGRNFTVLLSHPGTPEWYRAMDGEDDGRQPPDVPDKSRKGGWIAWGELSATFPARLLPEEPSTVEVEHLHLPGVSIQELDPEMQRVAFVRELTLRADDSPTDSPAIGR